MCVCTALHGHVSDTTAFPEGRDVYYANICLKGSFTLLWTMGRVALAIRQQGQGESGSRFSIGDNRERLQNKVMAFFFFFSSHQRPSSTPAEGYWRNNYTHLRFPSAKARHIPRLDNMFQTYGWWVRSFTFALNTCAALCASWPWGGRCLLLWFQLVDELQRYRVFCVAGHCTPVCLTLGYCSWQRRQKKKVPHRAKWNPEHFSARFLLDQK